MAMEIISIIVFLLFIGIVKGYYSDYGSKNNPAVYRFAEYIFLLSKKNIKSLSAIFFSFAIILLFFLILLLRPLPSFGIEINEARYSSNYLNMSREIFYVQTPGNCAPYSVMAVLNVLRGEKPDPQLLAQETGWRVGRSETFPQGLIELLKKYEIRTREYSLRAYRDDKKLLWLRNNIDNGNPLILFVRDEDAQHYFTVLGYDEDGFMIYDSAQKGQEENPRMTIVDREDYAGNRYFTNDELIEAWNSGGFSLFFRNWAVVCSLAAPGQPGN